VDIIYEYETNRGVYHLSRTVDRQRLIREGLPRGEGLNQITPGYQGHFQRSE